MADINRDISIEQIDYNIDINNINFTIDIQPRSNYTIELNAQGAQGRQGEKGDTGNGILSISKIKTEGNVDTYRITYTNGDYYDYTVTNASLDVEWGDITGSIENQLDLQEELNTKQDTLTAGDGISIENNVISNTRTNAEWGNITGDLSNQTDLQNVLDTKQDNLIAGENITIEDNVISSSSYAPPLLSFQWTDHILNDIRWLRGDTFSWQDGTVYFGAYDTLEAEYNNVNSNTETEYVSSNVNIVGSLKDNKGILSGFASTTTYASLPVKKPTNSFELVVKAHTPTVFSGNSVIQTLASGLGFIWRVNAGGTSSMWMSSNGTSNDILDNYNPNLTIPTNSDVWFKVSWNGTQYNFATSIDGSTWTNGTPYSSTAIVNWQNQQGIGGGSWESYPWLNGTIDLNGSYLDIDGERWWSGVNGITYKRTPNKYKIADISQEEAILNKYNTEGIAWFYIIDTVNKRFKLPRTKYGFTGIRDSVGNDVEAGLPNITGELYGWTKVWMGADAIVANGALRKHGTSGKYSTGSESNTDGNGIDFNASWSNSIYGNSDTVQPPATQMYLYFYVGSYTTDAVENTAGLNAELFNSKADINLNNTSPTSEFATLLKNAGIITVIETYHNGTDWYRVYSDGWCEQGGYIPAGSTGATINLLKNYANTNYQVKTSPYSSGNNFTSNIVSYPQSVSKFVWDSYNNSATSKIWEAKGYIA